MNRPGWLVLLTVLGMLLPPRQGSAAPETVVDLSQYGDYDIAHEDWNGLSTLAAIAQGVGLEVVNHTEIDWSQLDSNDVVLLIYPTRYVDPADMATFIRNGGRVLIADDFGASKPVVSRLGARRRETLPNATNYHDNQTFAPIAAPVVKHPLTSGVSELTTNHPAAIANLEGMESVFAFEDGSSLVAVGTIGSGQYVTLADPSVLINGMLQFEDNLQFAFNLISYLRRDNSDRIVVLTGQVNFAGRPRNHFDDGTWRGQVSGIVTDFDGWLDELNQYLLTATSLRIVAVLLAMGLGVLLFIVFPTRRASSLDGSWTRAGPSNNGHGNHHLVGHYSQAAARTSYLLPAAIERDNINTVLETLMEVPEPLYSLSEAELLRRISALRGAAVAQELKHLLPRVRALPQRAQAAAHWQPRFLGRNEFEAIHRQATAVHRSLAPSDKT